MIERFTGCVPLQAVVGGRQESGRLLRRNDDRADGKSWKGGRHIKGGRSRVASVRKGMQAEQHRIFSVAGARISEQGMPREEVDQITCGLLC